MTYCPSGHPNPEGKTYCSVCYKYIGPPADEPEPAPAPEPPPPDPPPPEPEAHPEPPRPPRPPVSTPTSFYLVVISGPRRGQRFGLLTAQTVGRADECELQLDNDSVSRRHARLTVADGQVTVEDLGSTNGTSVNGIPVEEPRQFVPGDVVAFGSVELRLGNDPGDDPTEGAGDDPTEGAGARPDPWPPVRPPEPWRPVRPPEPMPAPPSGERPKTDGLAIAGLILAVASFVVFPLLPAIIALFVAKKSRAKIDASGGALTGDTLVTISRVVAWLNVLVALVAVLLGAGAFFWLLSS